MPTDEVLARFLRDYDALTAEQQRAFRQAIKKLIDDVDDGRFRAGLRVKGIKGMPGHHEMTWAPDGRAIFRSGAPVRPELRHVIWVAIGTHDVLP
ncbi:MAG: hypothetical protein ACRDYX_21400 [Egibacteraceae bacterium]